MRILLVEDSKFLRLATGRTLARAGYEMSFAGDGDDETLLMGQREAAGSHSARHDVAENERAGSSEGTQERTCYCGGSSRSADWTLPNKCRTIAARWSFRFSGESGPCAGSGCSAPLGCIDETLHGTSRRIPCAGGMRPSIAEDQCPSPVMSTIACLRSDYWP